MGARLSETSQRWNDVLHVDPNIASVLRGLEEGEQPRKERSWLLVVPLSLQSDLREKDHAGVSGGHLGRRKTLCRLYRRRCWIGMGRDVE